MPRRLEEGETDGIIVGQLVDGLVGGRHEIDDVAAECRRVHEALPPRDRGGQPTPDVGDHLATGDQRSGPSGDLVRGRFRIVGRLAVADLAAPAVTERLEELRPHVLKPSTDLDLDEAPVDTWHDVDGPVPVHRLIASVDQSGVRPQLEDPRQYELLLHHRRADEPTTTRAPARSRMPFKPIVRSRWSFSTIVDQVFRRVVG